VLADNFIGRVAFDAFRAAVPGDHAAFRVHHIDGIVGDALDQNVKLSGAVQQLLCAICSRAAEPRCEFCYSTLQGFIERSELDFGGFEFMYVGA
jgi:hypothetical protein